MSEISNSKRQENPAPLTAQTVISPVENQETNNHTGNTSPQRQSTQQKTENSAENEEKQAINEDLTVISNSQTSPKQPQNQTTHTENSCLSSTSPEFSDFDYIKAKLERGYRLTKRDIESLTDQQWQQVVAIIEQRMERLLSNALSSPQKRCREKRYTKRFLISLEPELYRRLVVVSKATGHSRSSLTRMALSSCINAYEQGHPDLEEEKEVVEREEQPVTPNSA